MHATLLNHFVVGKNCIIGAGALVPEGMVIPDNSGVVIENVYRLRSRGVPAARAAVQGTKQVGMSVVASTLTLSLIHICGCVRIYQRRQACAPPPGPGRRLLRRAQPAIVEIGRAHV